MDTLGKVLQLLRHDDAEVRCAAAIVAGRLRPVDDRTLRALRRALGAADIAVKSYFLDALAATKRPEVIPDLLPFLDSSGSLVEQVIQILRGFGSKALAAIMALHEGGRPWISGAYIKVVAGIGHRDAVKMVFERIHDSSWDHARAASIFLRENWSIYPARVQEFVRSELRRYLARPAADRTNYATITCLRMADFLDETVDLDTLLELASPAFGASLRRHALKLLEEQRLTKKQIERIRPSLCAELRSCADDRVSAALLEVLAAWSEIPMPRDELLELADDGRPPVVDFALRELARLHGRESADDIEYRLTARHPAVRVAAVAALASMPGGHERLLHIMLSTGHPRLPGEIADRLAAANGTLSDKTLARLRKSYVDQCLGDGCDRAVLDLNAGLDREGFNRSLLARARRMMREERYEDVIALLQPLVRWRHATEEARFLLAVANLRLAAGSFDTKNRHFGRCIGLFAPLSRTDGYDLAARLRRAKTLAPAELLGILDALVRLGAAEREVVRSVTDRMDASGLAPADRAIYDDVVARLETTAT